MRQTDEQDQDRRQKPGQPHPKHEWYCDQMFTFVDGGGDHILDHFAVNHDAQLVHVKRCERREDKQDHNEQAQKPIESENRHKTAAEQKECSRKYESTPE